MRALRRCVGACVAVGLLLLMASGASAAERKCVVVNVGTGQSYSTLQAAVNAVTTTGDTLKVKGTCYGTTRISKNLTIVGESVYGSGQATLDGAKSGSVVTVERGVTVAITRLTITGGSGSPEPFTSSIVGGGITNFGSLTLTDSTVSGNTAFEVGTGGGKGGGIFNGGEYSPEASLTITDSTVSGNETHYWGGGIGNEEGSVTLNDSTVSRNTARQEGGGIAQAFRGSLTITDSTVADNTAVAVYLGLGGGIAVIEGSLTLTNSTVRGNAASLGGGGIYGSTTIISGGGRNSLTLDNSAVTRNTATGSFELEGTKYLGHGGGILDRAGTVTLNGASSVSRNEAAGDGGGIYSGKTLERQADSVRLNDSSSVTRNTAGGDGGGIYSEKSGGATLTFGTGWTGVVSRNEPDDIFNF
jgi:predicted outer membrane repeat protein